MAKSKIGTGGIIAITLGSVAVIGGALYFIFKKKKPVTPNVDKTPKSNKPTLSSTPINNNTADKALQTALGSLADKLLKGLVGGSKGIGGGSGSSSGGSGGKLGSSNTNTNWKQDNEGYWIDPTDGRKYWENEDGTLTDKETGDMYDPNTGEWLGTDYGDGSYSDTDGKMYVWNEETGKWEEGGWVYNDGSWSDLEGNIYDENDNQIGYDNFDGSWTDIDGKIWDSNTDEQIGIDYGNGYWEDMNGQMYDENNNPLTEEQMNAYYDDPFGYGSDNSSSNDSGSSDIPDGYAIGRKRHKNNIHNFYRKK